MPELAEVAYFCRQWNVGIGKPIQSVHLHHEKRVFRESDPCALKAGLTGARLRQALTHGKQMCFVFTGGSLPGGANAWLGVHLGMTGRLFAEPTPFAPDPHDHLVLKTAKMALVFRDPRLFGRIRFAVGREPPAFWRGLPPEVHSPSFSRSLMEAHLRRRGRSPIKAVLLDQACFPGVGNWMADEILWQTSIHPARLAASLSPDEVGRLYRVSRHICRVALRTIGLDFRDPPASWLFAHRWRDGGRCPKSGELLVRETIAGRTTCFAPTRQRAES